MGVLSSLSERWVALSTDETTLPSCPDCGADLERDHVHDSAFQSHWRGTPAWVCPECDYAERREG